jgi:hypothetical protein
MDNEIPYWKFQDIAKKKYRESNKKEFSDWFNHNNPEIKPKPLENMDGAILIFTVFTAEDKDYLRRELEKFESETVEKFLLHLEIYCQNQLMLTESSITKAKHKKKLEKMKGSFELTLKYLRMIEKGKIEIDYIPYLRKIYKKSEVETITITSKDPLPPDVKESDYWSACEAQEYLYRLTQSIKDSLKQNHDRKPGRPKPSTDRFVKFVAEIYDEYFEKPTNYQDGPFYSVVQFALEKVKLPHKAPRRAIEKALKGNSVQK